MSKRLIIHILQLQTHQNTNGNCNWNIIKDLQTNTETAFTKDSLDPSCTQAQTKNSESRNGSSYVSQHPPIFELRRFQRNPIYTLGLKMLPYLERFSKETVFIGMLNTRVHFR